MGFMDWKCEYCGRTLPRYYVNKGDSYWGNRGRYSFRGARANALRHLRACEKSYSEKAANKSIHSTPKGAADARR